MHKGFNRAVMNTDNVSWSRKTEVVVIVSVECSSNVGTNEAGR